MLKSMYLEKNLYLITHMTSEIIIYSIKGAKGLRVLFKGHLEKFCVHQKFASFLKILFIPLCLLSFIITLLVS